MRSFIGLTSDKAYVDTWNAEQKRIRELATKHNVRLVSFIYGEQTATGKPEDLKAFEHAVLNRTESK